MEFRYVFVQVFFTFTHYPFFEVAEVELRLSASWVDGQPSDIPFEIKIQLVLVEDPVDHVATEYLQFEFVLRMHV